MTERILEAKEELWDKAFNESSTGSEALPLDQIKRAYGTAEKAWHAASKRKAALAKARAEAEARTGRSIDSPDPAEAWRPLFAPLALGVLAVGGGAFLALHEGRDHVRCALRARFSQPTAVLLAAGLAATALAADPTNALVRERDELSARVTALKAANVQALKALQEQEARLRQGRALFWLATPTDEKAKQVAFDVLDSAKTLQEQFLKARVSARLTRRLLDDAVRIDKEVAKDREALANFVGGYQLTSRTEGLAKIAACGGVAFAAIAPLSVVRRRRRREREEEKRLCPRCLSKDTLQTLGPATDDPDADPRKPKSRLVACVACEYETRENYLNQSRLCFPTVGIRNSGKTHWLGNVYDQIKNKDLAVKAVIRKIASRGDERFDLLVRELKYDLVRPSATTVALPEPLMFHIRDADPWGRNKTMVNLFDFAGELMNFTIDGELDPQTFRRRALLCEGFTLFLDPTQVNRQRQGFHRLADSSPPAIRRRVALDAGRPFGTGDRPADRGLRLEDRPPGQREPDGDAGRRADRRVAPDVGRADHARPDPAAFATGRAGDADHVPGLGGRAQLREGFGGRFMFFPMSAVGLEESELGNDVLSERQITPFGMLEPLLWLLHMHGYCVLT